MIANIIDFDTSLFLFLNGLHAEWLNDFFYYISQIYTWIPLYILILFIIIKRWKKQSIPIIVAILMTIICTDQSCNAIKHTIQRERPSHNSALASEIHLVTGTSGELYRGGHYGFPSAHAANSIAFALFVIFFVAQRNKWIIISVIFWSLLLAYSRIYLGVHYPLDIICGLLLGSCWSLFWIWFSFKLLRRYQIKKV